MNKKSLRLLLIMLAFPLFSMAQVEGKKELYNPRQSEQETLLIAEKQKESNPLKALEMIQDVVSQERNKKQGSKILGQAYFLLGNIYEQIEQDDLALQRYNTALQNIQKGESDLRAKVYYRLGVIYLQKRDEKGALTNFTFSGKFSRDKGMKLKSDEGIADIKLMMNDSKAAISDLEALIEKYDLDSISLARIEARKVQAYVQLKDYDNASDALQYSYNTLPRNTGLNKADVKELEKANETFFSNSEISNEDKINVQNTINYADINDDNLVRENFRKSLLYEEDNELDKAGGFLEISKNNINTKTSLDLAAEVYKKSYETNLKKGKITSALKDLQKYLKAKENEVVELKNDLKEEIEIVKSQKRIDIAEKDYTLREKSADLLENQIITHKLIIGFLSLILLASAVFFYFLYKNIKAKRRANQMLYLKSLRTQMNPHFIFNALNSVNNFIAQNDEKAANKFLADFSQLMRKVLDYSQKDFIGIQEEIELNELYLKLEHFRFRDKFEYSFENQLSDMQKLEVPPMLIQPFIENAVWHGLRYKESEGKLKISFEESEDHVLVLIEDNGIGREKSKALKTKNQKKYNSTGLNNVSKRIELINEIYLKNYEIEVEDLDPEQDDIGTIVKVKIPMN